MTSPILQIDGAYGEGGGQIIRTAVALGKGHHSRLCVARQFLPIEFEIAEQTNGNSPVTVTGVDPATLKYR